MTKKKQIKIKNLFKGKNKAIKLTGRHLNQAIKALVTKKKQIKNWDPKDCCEKCHDIYFDKTFPAHTAYDACVNPSCKCHRRKPEVKKPRKINSYEDILEEYKRPEYNPEVKGGASKSNKST